METINLWNGVTIPRMGLGTWAAGGLTIWPDGPVSYGRVTPDEAIAGIRCAYDLGIRLFDTAAAYGAGNAELILGEALRDKADAVIVTKCGFTGDPATRRIAPVDLSPAAIRKGVEASLARLKRPMIDAVLLHHNELDPAKARPVFDTLEILRTESLIECYGWSTDHVGQLATVTDYPGFRIVEHDLNVFDNAWDMLRFVEAHRLYSLARLPLAMGLLSGKYNASAPLADTDVRSGTAPWLKYFKKGAANPSYVAILEKIAPALTTGGRSLSQGALSWILGASDRTIPIPGFTSISHIPNNFGAVTAGRLSEDDIERLRVVVAKLMSSGT
ncbi:aldo/keto reductase [Pleomorphomonas oryzae]|uniref:aldo/keto reductase n=1 Tax=Pleomorphomonas oryzae TaxID=261934 RepID=UPI0003F90ED0|nr:aldo/keto reductase [Pleomorphomonas oryzae]